MNGDRIYDEAMSEVQRVGLMSGSIATDRCRCATCGEVFTTESNLDRHLTPGRTVDDFVGQWCQPPATRSGSARARMVAPPGTGHGCVEGPSYG